MELEAGRLCHWVMCIPTEDFSMLSSGRSCAFRYSAFEGKPLILFSRKVPLAAVAASPSSQWMLCRALFASYPTARQQSETRAKPPCANSVEVAKHPGLAPALAFGELHNSLIPRRALFPPLMGSSYHHHPPFTALCFHPSSRCACQDDRFDLGFSMPA